jgi:hypothetical protein
MWPQWTLLTMYVLNVGFILAKDGQPREPYSFWWYVIGAALDIWLLYMGGFFKGL